jgi:Glycosyltransferase family 87
MFHRKTLDWAFLIVLLGIAAWCGKIWRTYEYEMRILQYAHTTRPATDFFQDWAAAREYLDGRSIYEPLRESFFRHAAALGLPYADDPPLLPINAHPPALILCLLPLGRLDFRTAYLVWTWTGLILLPVSLYLTIRSLAPPVETRAALLVSLGLTLMLVPSSPIAVQFGLGNVQMVMLFLVSVALASVGRGKGGDLLAGAVVGLATAIKLFPGFLVIYFLITRRFRALAAMGVIFASLQIASLAVFGNKAFLEFINLALPEIQEWRGAHNNVSIYGIWARLFDKGSYADSVFELTHWPELAQHGYVASALIVLCIYLISVWKARIRDDDGRLLGLSLTTMLLLAPITWVHSQILLIPSIAVLARVFPGPNAAAWALRLASVAIWIDASYFVHYRLTPLIWGDRLYRPIATVMYASIDSYAMLAVFALGCLSVCRPEGD